MAIVVPIVSEFADQGIVAAQAGFNNFKNKVAEADGAMGKFKAGAGAALDAVKANAVAFASAAGAAITAFAIKGMNDFVDLALAAGKFADATGLAVDDASRWIEVSGDFGVEAQTVEKAINKMNVAISAQKKEFGALGAEVVYTKDGLVDVNATFLNTIDKLKAIPSATERARLGAAVLGKGWMDMAELVQMGSVNLTSALNAVGDAKVINPDELQKAKDFRASMDRLGDAFQSLAMNLGTLLVPAMNLFNNTVGKVLEGVNNMMGGTSDLDRVVMDMAQNAKDDAVKALIELQGAFYKNYVRAGELRYRALQLGDAINVLDDDTNGLIDTFDALLNQFERDEAVEGLTAAFKEYQKTVLEALGQATPEAGAKANEAMKSLVREMAQVAKQAGLTSQEQVKIVALLEKGQYDLAYEELLRQIAAVPRQIPIEFIGSVSGIPVPAGQTPSETVGVPPTIIDTPYGKFKPTPGGGFEFYNPPTIPSKGAYSTGMNVNVNVAGSVTSERDLIETIRKGLVDAQRSGKQLVYSNT